VFLPRSAVGINAAGNRGNFGTFRLGSSTRKATPVCRALEGATGIGKHVEYFKPLGLPLPSVAHRATTEDRCSVPPG